MFRKSIGRFAKRGFIPEPSAQPTAKMMQFFNSGEKQFYALIDAPILWGQLDAFNHLNNCYHYRFFEHARIHYFLQMAKVIGDDSFLNPHSTSGRFPGIVVSRSDCVYKVPLDFPDTVTLGTYVDKVKEDRFTMNYRMVSRAREVVAADGSAEVVTFDFLKGKKTSLPQEFIDSFNKIQSE